MNISNWALMLAGMLALALATDPTFTVDDSYGLAVIVTNIPAGTACTISWQRSDGVGPRVSQSFAANAIIRLRRFTPRKEYKIQVKDTHGRIVGSKEFYTCTAGGTGVAQYDVDAPFVLFMGEPSFDILVVDHGDGLVGFNKDGWIVWYLPKANGAWDQLPADQNYDIVTLMGGATLSSSGLEELTSAGKNVSSVTLAGLSHEARVDHVNPDQVLSVQGDTRNITGLKDPIMGSAIVRWSRKSGTVDTVYNLFDFYDPVTDYGQCSGRNDSSACVHPLGSTYSFSPFGNGEDWTHANSVERGTRDNYIMSVRHLSSVISFHADGSGIQWVLSGEGVKPSKDPTAVVLKYAADGERQYMEHCARQLDNGNLILFDNGDLREPPFTRFSEYEIDVEKGTAKLVWQFVPMLDNATSGQKMFAFHAGSVQRLANGNTVGALSCDNTRVGLNCSHTIFEADSKGNEIARAFVPKPTTSDPGRPGDGAGYRGLPLITLGGEREVSVVASQIIV